MQQETRNCQNCKKDFVIEPDDFSFYEKIKVPPPTFCPECRTVRRMLWRNERELSKKKCNAPGHREELISMYGDNSHRVIYDQEYWWSDKWDPMEYGQPYDFQKSFFNQYNELLQEVPSQALANVNAVNSEWCNPGIDNKNCYLCFAATKNEDMAYSNRISSCRDSFDIYIADKCELCSNSLSIEKCTGIHFSMRSKNCIDSWFLYDCNNCNNCVGCVNLRNKQYHIFNTGYTKEKYQKKFDDLHLNTHSGLEAFKKEFDEFILSHPRRYANLINAVNSTGDNLQNVKNSKWCFDIVNGMEDSKFCIWGGYGWKDSYDGLGCNGELMYELSDAGAVGRTCSHTYFSVAVQNSVDAQYCHSIKGCSHVFGCIGLRDKQYCILNKQYSKEEYEALAPKIIKHMNDMPYTDKKGRIYKYGEFFPTELSPFGYNETIAQEYFPLTKEQAINKGYIWKDPEPKNYNITKKLEDLPDSIKDVDDSILNGVIECQHNQTCNEQCTQGFKIIPQELQFYKKMNLPLPHLCPNCRHYQRLKQRNPLKLWHRQCMCDKSNHEHTGKCTNEFETSYAPDRPEIVYCEQCYQQEVA